jgi:hypothetical protein
MKPSLIISTPHDAVGGTLAVNESIRRRTFSLVLSLTTAPVKHVATLEGAVDACDKWVKMRVDCVLLQRYIVFVSRERARLQPRRKIT